MFWGQAHRTPQDLSSKPSAALTLKEVWVVLDLLEQFKEGVREVYVPTCVNVLVFEPTCHP